MSVRHRTTLPCATVVAVALAGCGSSMASPAPRPASAATTTTTTTTTVKRSHAAAAPPRSAIDRLAAVARRRYSEEVTGAAAHKQLRRVAADPVLLRALRKGNVTALRAEVRLQDANVRTSLPAAARIALPSTGTVTVAGHRYVVRSFRERGLAGEALRIWILERG